MARESSVAPKERINVIFKPATGGAVEEIELPMKVVVLGDFLRRFDDRPLETRKPVPINKDNFNEVMAKQELVQEFSVRNRLTDDPDANMNVKLAYGSIRDFEPGNIIEQVPELRKLKDMRDALTSLKGPLGNMPAFRKRLEEMLKSKEQREKVLSEIKSGPESAREREETE